MARRHLLNKERYLVGIHTVHENADWDAPGEKRLIGHDHVDLPQARSIGVQAAELHLRFDAADKDLRRRLGGDQRIRPGRRAILRLPAERARTRAIDRYNVAPLSRRAGSILGDTVLVAYRPPRRNLRVFGEK